MSYKIIFSFFLLIIISIIYSCNTKVTSAPSSFELFPLSKGKSYLYSYYYHDRYRTSYEFYTDSGTVQYNIMDSVKLSSNTISWTIKEFQRYYHSQLKPGTRTDLYSDTTYLVDTTNIFTLEENLSGLHEIKCKSLAWTFPYIDSIFMYPKWTKTDTVKIHRYSNNDQYLFAYSTSNGSIFLHDTLSFFANKGMVYFRRDYFIDVNTGNDQTLKFKLIN